jgi:DNA-binding NtrC family response regulator
MSTWLRLAPDPAGQLEVLGEDGHALADPAGERLAEHFLQLILEEQNMGPKKIRPDAMNALQELDWTGNIRELRNVVERLIILSDQEITATDVEVFAKPNKK